MCKCSYYYDRIYQGYYKILDTIDSCETLEHLSSCRNMIDNWVELIGYYCYNVSRDWDIPKRKRASGQLAELCQIMFENIKEVFEEQNRTLIPEEYTGSITPVRIKSLQEYAG